MCQGHTAESHLTSIGLWVVNLRALADFLWGALKEEMDASIKSFHPSFLHRLLSPTVKGHISHGLVRTKPTEYTTGQSPMEPMPAHAS